MHGFLNLDKPAGMTSHDLVNRVRRLTRQRRIGHAGTLDPAATGVLVIGLGQATRLIEYVQEETEKRYLATIQLGQTTSTDDAEGAVTDTQPIPTLSAEAIHQLLQQFIGTLQQTPPAYSAIHIDGQRAYDLARRGVAVDLPPREVVITQITLLWWNQSQLHLDIVCGKGTYIRSLARDIGITLGCGAHLANLRRTAVGSFTIDRAITLEQLEHQPIMPETPTIALSAWSHITVDAAQIQAIRYGQSILLESQAERLYALDSDGTLVALLAPDQDRWRPTKVFDWS